MAQMKSYRTLCFRIDRKLDKQTYHKLWTLSNEHVQLYNHLLDQVWKRLESGGRIDMKQINEDYKNFRNDNQLTSPSKSAQNTSRVLIDNIKSYYALKKKDPDAKFPKRFRTTKKFNSFIYDWNSGRGGFKVKGNELKILKPEITIRIPNYIMEDADFDDIKTVSFFGRDGFIYCAFCVAIFTEDKQLDPTRYISFDPGLKTLLTGVTCDGEIIQFKNYDFRKEDKANDKLKSKRDKAKKYSKRYKRLSQVLNRRMSATSNKRKDYHHKVTAKVIDFCEERNIGLIIHGDIKTKKLTKSKISNRYINRSTQNRGSLSRIKQFLAYKANSSGIVHVLQNEAYTSKTNCYTGEIIEGMTLATREIKLTEDLVIDRDVNGAINIATKYFRQHEGIWSTRLDWLANLKDTRINFDLRMSKFD